MRLQIVIGMAMALLAPLPAAPKLVSIPPGRRLIEWGWDEPSPAFMREHWQEMDRVGFDGVIFHAEPTPGSNFAWECWSRKQFEVAGFKQNIEDVRSCRFERMTDLFLRFNVCPGDVDWFDDEGMAIVMHNAAVGARVAREMGCQGFMFDIEQYGKPLFSYQSQAQKETRSFAEYEAKVRQRGREFMQAVQGQYPDITMMMTFGYGITGLKSDRSKTPYGLLKNLLDGMYEAAARGATIVDAYEGAYPFRKCSQFAQARQAVKEGMLQYTAAPEQYRKHNRVGFGIWMDMDFRRYGWHTNPADFEANYFLPHEFEYSVFCGLQATDRYVWVYTEKPLWWTHTRVPYAYRRALKRAKQPHVIDDSSVGKRQIRGDVGPPGGGPAAAVQPGYDDESTFGDLKDKYDFIADLPKTWRFKLDKSNVGIKEKWYAPALDVSGWQTIEIGKFWDEQKINHVGFAWYRLDWDAPQFSAPPGKDLWLWFGAVDEAAWVYVNGTKAGEHDVGGDLGWDKRFPIKVTGLLKPGQRNTMAVRVGNEALAGGIWKSVKLAVEK